MKNRTLIIYPLIIAAILSITFILLPAVAQQKQDNVKIALTAGEGEEIKAIMKALEERENELARREGLLRKEEERLAIMKRSIEQSLKQYSNIRSKLQKDIESDSERKDNSSHGMARIAKIYESMSPEDAAQRIEQMGNEMAVELLARIKNKQAGKIMGAISPEKAALLTTKLAEKKRGK